MTTPQKGMDERVKEFKPLPSELQLVGRLPTEANGSELMEAGEITLTVRELSILAEYYFDELSGDEYYYAYSGQFDGGRYRYLGFVAERLGLLYDALGKERYEEAIARTKREWGEQYRQLEELEKRVWVCGKCGGETTIVDEVHGYETGMPQDWCYECQVAESDRRFCESRV